MVSTKNAEGYGDTVLGTSTFHGAQTRPGFCYVSADVDSQEMWIASLFADMEKGCGEVGAAGVSYMTLSGSKEAGTDIHTVTANAVGMDRNTAKALNYARIYLCGKSKAESLMGGGNEATKKVDALWKFTKGVKRRTGSKFPDHIEGYIEETEKKLQNLGQCSKEGSFYNKSWSKSLVCIF